MPVSARSSDWRSRRSPSQKSRSSAPRCARGLLLRTSARTEKPAPTRQRATAEPTNPLAPVTRTLSLSVMPASERVSSPLGDPRTSPAEEALSSILQTLDQAVGAARGDDRPEFVASRRQVADRAIEIDIDHPSAANQIVDVDDPPAGLHQPRLDDLAAAARFRSGLRINDETLSRIIFDLARIVGHDESRKSLLHGGLLGRREAFPGWSDRQPRHGREVEGCGN